MGWLFQKRCEGVAQGLQRRAKVRQGLEGLAQVVLDFETGLRFVGDLAEVVRDQLQVAVGLTPVEPDDGLQVLLLLGGEVVDLARDLAVDVARVDHQHLVFVRLGFVAVEEPQLAGHGAGVEEVRADGDHGVHVAGLHQLLPHLGLAAAGAGGLRGHDEAGAALVAQVAVEVADPDVVAVADLALLVDAGQAEGQARVGLDLVGVDLVDVEGRIGHDVVGLADQFVRVFVVGDGLLDVAFQAVDGQIHLGQADGGGVFLQAAEGEFFRGAVAVLFDDAGALHEHAAGAAGRVEHGAALGVDAHGRSARPARSG